MAKRLALHVGHGKTGSSYLQAWLARNAERLATAGVIYPTQAPSGRFDPRARRGGFSMGNGFVLEELRAAVDPTAALAALAHTVPDGGVLLFSDERLMKRLVGRLEATATWATRAGFQGLDLLLFVRDPLEHARSLYLEMVKAHGYADTLDAWLAVYELPLQVLQFLEEQAALSVSDLHVHNYSRCSSSILPLLQTWLQLPGQAIRWPLPPRQRVNRSLSARELQLMRGLNRCLGQRAGKVGRLLVHWRRGAHPASPQPSSEAAVAFQQRLEPWLQGINCHLGLDQQLRGLR